MALKIISLSYIIFTLFLFSISYTTWRFKSVIRYAGILRITTSGGLLLQLAYVLFSSFYKHNLSLYREAEKIFISKPVAICGLFIIAALLGLQIPCAAKCAKTFAKLFNKSSLESMPSKIREIYRAESNRQISQKQAEKRQNKLEKQINFFEKMSRVSSEVFKASFVSMALILANFCFCFFAQKVFYSNTAQKAFFRATGITLWNAVIFIIPFVLICLAILTTCRFTKKAEKSLKINTKMRHYKATKSSGIKNKKDKKSAEPEPVPEIKNLIIELGYGLTSLTDEKKESLLPELISEMKDTYPQMPEVTVLDNLNFKTWEFKLSYQGQTYQQTLSGSETYDIMLLKIFEAIQYLVPECK